MKYIHSVFPLLNSVFSFQLSVFEITEIRILSLMNFLFFLTIILSFYLKDFKKVAWFGFLGGIIWDVVFVNVIGLTSLGLLGISFLIYLYRQKFSSSHLLFQLFFVITSYSIIAKIQDSQWQWQNAVLLTALTLAIYLLLTKLKFSSNLELEY